MSLRDLLVMSKDIMLMSKDFKHHSLTSLTSLTWVISVRTRSLLRLTSLISRISNRFAALRLYRKVEDDFKDQKLEFGVQRRHLTLFLVSRDLILILKGLIVRSRDLIL